MSHRTITHDYFVATHKRILKSFTSHEDAANYRTAVQRAHFLPDDEHSTLTIETRKANR